MSQLASAPYTRTRTFQGAQDTVQEMIKAALGDRGERSILVRTRTDQIVAGLADKSYLSEIIAVRNYVAANVKYRNDALGVEQVKDPQRLVEEIDAWGKGVGDCDDISTLIAGMLRQLGRRTRIVIVGFTPEPNFSHVFSCGLEPRSKKWIVCDPVAGSDEAKMLRRVKHWKAFEVDQ